jgi:3'-phosphoadenosine 5'-phosphosulfate sulfotransferase (PAPS reductase)/FAD synthetase
MSAPLSFWTEKDVWEYIHKYNIKYSKIYDMGHERTGCMFCMFGIQFPGVEGCGRFNLMRETHPKQYKYIMERMKGREIIEYLNVNLKTKINIKEETQY